MRGFAIALALVTAFFAVDAKAESTLTAVRERGVLNCGVTAALLGFSAPDAQGVFRGMDADLCRGIATAIFGDPAKVRFVTTSPTQRFVALQSGTIDVLIYAVTQNFSRDTGLGLIFANPYFYDGQGFVVSKKLNVTSAKQLEGASVCLQPASDAAPGAADYFRRSGMQFKAVMIESQQEIVSALNSGRCDVYTTDLTALAAMKVRSFQSPEDWVILPEIISKSPFAPVVRQGDDQWLTLVRWVVNAIIDADELGVDSHTIKDTNVASDNPEVRRMRGLEGEAGKAFGLPNDWAAQVVAAIGNYNEFYNRNLSALGLPRGPNRSWRDGGLIFAPSFR
ncbi:amino acid ABC transporter substrate-binding protein [Bradyrhizobium rifense]|uniref:Amino acid ABC transporter substrate-binding protein n=1 Tax=Bradyrhizobium rifense TaxID=515499 RepID=A0A5D3K2L4_9BRAD|nr:amino acid ABC transporter substrate-binding protein [Bradyrhizobium rifense]TYL88450.1 amino acid ABC transporter substrate-binding protein [Bradyrhizobium rifense]